MRTGIWSAALVLAAAAVVTAQCRQATPEA